MTWDQITSTIVWFFKKKYCNIYVWVSLSANNDFQSVIYLAGLFYWKHHMTELVVLHWLPFNNNDFVKLQASAVHIGKISFIGIKGTSASEEAIRFACSDSSPCQGLYMEDVQLLTDTGIATSYCWKAQGSSSGIVYPPPCFSTDESMIKQKTFHALYYSSWLLKFTIVTKKLMHGMAMDGCYFNALNSFLC